VSREYVLERRQVVPYEREEAFAFFADARNLERITPSWLNFRIVDAPDAITGGARLRYRLKLFGIPIRWRTEIVEWSPSRSFTDVQRRGPFKVWEHTHRLRSVEGGTEVYDHVRYALFLGPLGALIRAVLVRGWVEGIFDHRARVVVSEIGRAPAEPQRRTA
jgi:ligand-binding SRPBCC domain-containing protein